MKISTKGRYGIAAMLHLALNASEGIVSVRSIADRLNLSERYLEQLFAVLRKAGLVDGMRGPQGGYRLVCSPGNITVGAILRALEGPLAPVGCVAEAKPDRCTRQGSCVVKKLVWEKLRNVVNEVVDSITLAHLVDEYNKCDEQKTNMYYI